jgi:hypothetical protein
MNPNGYVFRAGVFPVERRKGVQIGMVHRPDNSMQSPLKSGEVNEIFYLVFEGFSSNCDLDAELVSVRRLARSVVMAQRVRRRERFLDKNFKHGTNQRAASSERRAGNTIGLGFPSLLLAACCSLALQP